MRGRRDVGRRGEERRWGDGVRWGAAMNFPGSWLRTRQELGVNDHWKLSSCNTSHSSTIQLTLPVNLLFLGVLLQECYLLWVMWRRCQPFPCSPAPVYVCIFSLQEAETELGTCLSSKWRIHSPEALVSHVPSWGFCGEDSRGGLPCPVLHKNQTNKTKLRNMHQALLISIVLTGSLTLGLWPIPVLSSPMQSFV